MPQLLVPFAMVMLMTAAASSAEPVELPLAGARLANGMVLRPTVACGPALLKDTVPEQSVSWVLPGTIVPGRYRLEFTGTSRVLPFVDSQARELEPYRIFVGEPPARAAAAYVTDTMPAPVAIGFQSFTHPDPAAAELLLDDLRHPVFASQPSAVRRRCP